MMGYFDTLDIRNTYNIAKRVAENIISSFQYIHGVNFIIFRICRCFGPMQKEYFLSDQRVLFSLFRQSIFEDKITLTSYGKQKYSYIYLPDCIKAFLFGIANLPQNNCYNIANPNFFCLEDFAKEICKIANKKLFFEIDDKKQDRYVNISNNILNTQKIQNYGFFCDYSIPLAILETYKILKEGRI